MLAIVKAAAAGLAIGAEKPADFPTNNATPSFSQGVKVTGSFEGLAQLKSKEYPVFGNQPDQPGVTVDQAKGAIKQLAEALDVKQKAWEALVKDGTLVKFSQDSKTKEWVPTIDAATGKLITTPLTISEAEKSYFSVVLALKKADAQVSLGNKAKIDEIAKLGRGASTDSVNERFSRERIQRILDVARGPGDIPPLFGFADNAPRWQPIDQAVFRQLTGITVAQFKAAAGSQHAFNGDRLRELVGDKPHGPINGVTAANQMCAVTEFEAARDLKELARKGELSKVLSKAASQIPAPSKEADLATWASYARKIAVLP